MDQHPFGDLFAARGGEEDRAEEVGLAGIPARDCADVRQEPFTCVDLPPVVPLVDRDDEGRALGGEPLDRVDGVGRNSGERHGPMLPGY